MEKKIFAPANGEIIELENITDEVFSSGIMTIIKIFKPQSLSLRQFILIAHFRFLCFVRLVFRADMESAPTAVFLLFFPCVCTRAFAPSPDIHLPNLT